MAGGRPVAVTKAARAALATADTEGNTVTIPDQLRASTWTGVKKVLELAGGTYVQGKSAWTFPSTAATVVAKLLADGQVVAARHSEGYVPTPAALAARLASPEFGAIADLPDGASVLEPSAGEGAIARAIIDAKPNTELYMLEPDDVRREQLHRMPRPDETTTHTINCTLESYIGSRQTYWTDHPLFDAAIMNPPFHVTGQRDVWETHILLVYEMLKPGGRLVAVVPASATSPHRTGPNLVRDLVEHDGSFTPIPLQEFQSAGIQVGVIVLDRPFDEARPAYLHRPYTGDEVPVRVTQPETSWVAALYKPVQVRYDPWHSKDRVFRNAGRCFTCHKPVWAHDDGDDDPRGVLGEHMATALDPRDYDKWGPAVMQCWTCSDNGDERSRALDFALAAHWQNRRDKPVQTPKRTRMSIGARVSQACRELGIPCESPTVDGYLGYVIAGRRMMTQEAADYLFEGGFDAAWGANTVQIRVDRLEESIAAKLAEPAAEPEPVQLALDELFEWATANPGRA